MSTQAWLLWGLFFSSFGVGYFIYGKKQRRAVALLCGIGLMVYPYFIGNLWAMLGIGIALLVLPFVVRV
ncbi:MAG: hypothetical protein JSR34_09820 [Proteobacteria bacterium]|nr:hypothetical protein [Pseudomonadota bacterium]